FQELTLLCQIMVPKEDEKIERMASSLMDQKVCTYAATSVKNKRKLDSNLRDNRAQPPPFKRQNVGGQNVARTYTAGSNKKRGCDGQGHYKSDCRKMKSQIRGNMSGNAEERGPPYAIRGGDVNPDSNVVTNVILSPLNLSCAVELADKRVAKTNAILRGCTLGLLGHPFDIDLMLVELRSFDVIVGMDWLSRYHAVIVCDEKVLRIPYGNEVLEIQGDGCSGGNVSRLSIISCTKTQKYINKGCLVFLAQVTEKEAENKLEEKQLEDVPIIRDFLKVFPEDLPRLPSSQQVEFQINLVPGTTPVARAPYRLAPSEMQELSAQLQELSDKGFIRPSSSP
ncbi:putative reverse transcriptase domain-containing protein, partial [Tanacetum coccineum]